MGGYFTKMLFLVLLFHLLVSSSCGTAVKPYENGVCVSLNDLEGKSPKSGDRELKDLNLCKWNTCCSASQMHSASLAVENLATYGEASKDCLELFELLECSICHPNVGIQSGHPPICASFCDRAFEACSDASLLFCDKFFEACSDAYFTSNVLIPCGASEDIIWGNASKWESNGTAFCDAVGFTVQTADDSVEEPCYGSKESLEPMMESELGSSEKIQKFVWFQYLQKQVQEMTMVQIISWVVLIVGLGGMLLYRWRLNQ